MRCSLAAAPVAASLMLLASASGAGLCADQIGPYGYGFRGDGTGVYPGCRPPIAWDDKTNIKWKAKLPNWGYSCPVPVAGKVFFMAEPFPPHYWPRLCCFDAETGRLLWEKDVNPLDAFPELTKEQRESLTADIAWVHDGLRATYRICFPLLAKGATKADEPVMVEINKKLAENGVRVESYTPGYGLLRKLKYLDPTRQKTVYKDLGKYGIAATTTWQNFGHARVGACFPTPVTDGERVYVMTVHGTVACFDLEGRLLWSRSAGYKGHHGLMSSPRLFHDLLLTAWMDTGNFFPVLIAWDRKTGKQVWKVDVAGGKGEVPGVRGSRAGGSLVVMTVGQTPVVICSGGRIVRLPDGKVYATAIPTHLATVAVDDANDAIFSVGSHDQGSSRWGFGLAIEGEELKRTQRFVHDGGGVASPVFAEGRLFTNQVQVDPASGVFLGCDASLNDPRKAKRTAPETRHLLLAANGHVYGLRQGGGGKSKAPAVGVCQVYTLAGAKVAENTLSAGPWDEESEARWQQQGFGHDFSYSCSMNIAGDRIYICSQDYLFCIGK